MITNDMFILVRSHVPEPERHEFFSCFFIYLYIVEKSNLILKFLGFRLNFYFATFLGYLNVYLSF